MLTVSLHCIRIHANIGLYEEELINGNDFETDVDIVLDTPNGDELPFVDYTLINDTVHNVFAQPLKLLEEIVQRIHAQLKQQVPDAINLKVCVRKLRPPMQGDIAYASVCYEA